MHEQRSQLSRSAQWMLLEGIPSETHYTGLAPARIGVRKRHVHKKGCMYCHLFVAEYEFDVLHFDILADDQAMINRHIRLSSYETLLTNDSASKCIVGLNHGPIGAIFLRYDAKGELG